MGKSVIQTKGMPALSVRNNASIPIEGIIAEITIPSDGIYFINYCGQGYNGWFNGVTDTSSSDYHASLSFAFLRLCKANEKIFVKNLTSGAHNYSANFQAAKIR